MRFDPLRECSIGAMTSSRAADMHDDRYDQHPAVNRVVRRIRQLGPAGLLVAIAWGTFVPGTSSATVLQSYCLVDDSPEVCAAVNRAPPVAAVTLTTPARHERSHAGVEWWPPGDASNHGRALAIYKLVTSGEVSRDKLDAPAARREPRDEHKRRFEPCRKKHGITHGKDGCGTIAPVPLPGTAVLLLSGGLALIGAAQRRRRTSQVRMRPRGDDTHS